MKSSCLINDNKLTGVSQFGVQKNKIYIKISLG